MHTQMRKGLILRLEEYKAGYSRYQEKIRERCVKGCFSPAVIEFFKKERQRFDLQQPSTNSCVNRAAADGTNGEHVTHEAADFDFSYAEDNYSQQNLDIILNGENNSCKKAFIEVANYEDDNVVAPTTSSWPTYKDFDLQSKQPGPNSKKEWFVEEIVGHHIVDGVDFYEVKWIGWPDITIEPLSNLTKCQTALDAYDEKRRQNRGKPSKKILLLPFQMEWIIKKSTFISSARFGIHTEPSETPCLTFTYRLSLYLNEMNDVVIFCTFQSKNDDSTDINLSIFVAEKETKINFEKASGIFSTYKAVIGKVSEIKRLFVGEKCILLLKGICIKKKQKRKRPFEGNSVASIMLQNDEGKDFEIVVGGKRLKIHKAIMGARGDFFNGLFNKDASWLEKEEVVLNEFSYSTVEKAVLFSYEQDIFTDIIEADALELIRFGELYGNLPLKKEAEEYLMKRIRIENVCTLANSSTFSNANLLTNACISFIFNTGKDLNTFPGFQSLAENFLNKLSSHKVVRSQTT
uniref:BTB domain-containing protein n=1 Tax=Panagrolaimus sp. ES5 TaxID=591445 RepID=A0AC34FRK0_9BILA